MLRLVRETTTTVHYPCEQRGLPCGDDSRWYPVRLRAFCLFRARDARLALPFLGVCWGATFLAGLLYPTTGRSVILWSDHWRHTICRDSGDTLPAATPVDDADQSGHV